MSDAREQAIEIVTHRLSYDLDWPRPVVADIAIRIVDALLSAGWRPPEPAEQGVGLIAAERRRQIESEGWTPEHDDQWHMGELIDVAIQYADEAAGGDLRADGALATFPWHPSWWKPSDDPTRNLVKAGALIAAEIDRRARAVPVSAPEAPK